MQSGPGVYAVISGITKSGIKQGTSYIILIAWYTLLDQFLIYWLMYHINFWRFDLFGYTVYCIDTQVWNIFWVDRKRPEKPTEPLVWTAKISCNLCLSGGHGKGYLDTTFSSKWCALSKVCACWNVIMYGFINCMCPCSVSIGYVDSAYADKT